MKYGRRYSGRAPSIFSKPAYMTWAEWRAEQAAIDADLADRAGEVWADAQDRDDDHRPDYEPERFVDDDPYEERYDPAQSVLADMDDRCWRDDTR